MGHRPARFDGNEIAFFEKSRGPKHQLDNRELLYRGIVLQSEKIEDK